MLDSGPCDETKVLGCQSPHMRLTYVATPETVSDRPTSRHHSDLEPLQPNRPINPCALTTHPPYEPAYALQIPEITEKPKMLMP
jgi:hypothetical protein